MLPSRRGKDGRGRPRLACLHRRGGGGRKKERKEREETTDRGGLNSNDRARPRACSRTARGRKVRRRVGVCVVARDATDTGSRGVARVRSNVGFCDGTRVCIAMEFRPLKRDCTGTRHFHSMNVLQISIFK